MDKEEEAAIVEMMAMTDAELELVPFTIVKWQCQGKGCTNGTKVRDYGIAPIYFHPRKSIRWFHIDDYIWNCSKHNKFVKRLQKSFSYEAICEKIFDPDKIKIQPLK